MNRVTIDLPEQQPDRITDHIIQRDTTCDGCDTELPKGFTAVEDIDTARVYCSNACWEEHTELPVGK